MNDGHQRAEFTARLRKVERRGLPDGWKDEVMAAAFPEEPEEGEVVVWWRPPRWLAAGLAACWVAIIALRLGAPVEEVVVTEMPAERIDLEQRQQLLARLELER